MTVRNGLCCSVLPVGWLEETIRVSYVDILVMVSVRYLGFDGTRKML